MAYADLVKSLGPSGYWRLNEASGTAADSSGSNQAATTTSPSAYRSAALLPTHDYSMDDASMTFNGASQVVTPKTAPAAANAPFTIDLWVTFDNLNWGNAVVLAYEGAASAQQELCFFVYGTNGQPGGPAMQCKNGATGTLSYGTTGAPITTANTPYHIATTFDGTTGQMYVNGVLQPSTGNTVSGTTQSYGGNNFYLGYSPDSYWVRLSGKMAHVATWTRALSATEVALLHAEALRGGVVT